MPANVRPVTDEQDGLLAFLDQQRQVLRIAAHGLDDAQAATAPLASTTLSVGGLVKHAAWTERGWMVETVAHRSTTGAPDYEAGFALAPGETLASVLQTYDEVAAETAAIVAELGLDHPVPVPDAPWYPKDVDAWSVRWVLLHLIEETARHAGHADIVREALDGQTAFPLMAASEGWESTPWD